MQIPLHQQVRVGFKKCELTWKEWNLISPDPSVIKTCLIESPAERWSQKNCRVPSRQIVRHDF